MDNQPPTHTLTATMRKDRLSCRQRWRNSRRCRHDNRPQPRPIGEIPLVKIHFSFHPFLGRDSRPEPKAGKEHARRPPSKKRSPQSRERNQCPLHAVSSSSHHLRQAKLRNHLHYPNRTGRRRSGGQIATVASANSRGSGSERVNTAQAEAHYVVATGFSLSQIGSPVGTACCSTRFKAPASLPAKPHGKDQLAAMLDFDRILRGQD
jgi:hypothetical protein